MKKIITLGIIFYLVPHTIFAAWWNPANWFKSEKEIPKHEINISTSTEPTTSKEIVKEIPIEKIIVKTEYRDNPDLIAQINSLKKQLAQCKVQLEPVVVNSNVPIKQRSTACEGFTERYQELSDEINELKKKYQEDLDYYSQYAQTTQIKSD
jgi:hypothetical protein